MYIRGERLPNEQHTLDGNLVSAIAHQNARVQGIDPGLVTMATGVATTSQCLLNSVNRFQALADNKLVLHPKDKYLPLALTAKMVNNGVGSNIDRKKMEKKKPSLKRIQKNRVKRKTRIKKFYQRKVTDDCGRKGSCITLTGNWSASVQHIKGHTRRSTKPFYSELAVSPQHHVLSVDENRSTITCSSCFKKTCKQPLIINGKLKRVAGAVICYNTQCPRRLTTKATTTNRDRNGAYNIASIGFSSFASRDGLPPPPPFRRSRPANK